PAHRDTKRTAPWPEEWLLIEWPEGDGEPAKYWFSNLPKRSSLKRLVKLAKARWWIERDYQDLKQGAWPWPLRGPQLARFPPSCQPVHRSLRLSHRRALPFPPSAAIHPQADRNTCATRRLPAARGCQCGLSGMCRTRLPPSVA